jgi:hypothetical protein
MKMKETSYKKAIELSVQLSQEIGYQERVYETAGECYDGHSQDIHDSKKLLNAVDTFIASCERNRD